MPPRLSELLRSVARDRRPRLLDDPRVAGVQFDSRRVREGELFVAIPGDRVNGHDFIADAVHRGAVAVVGERPSAAVGLPANVPYVTVGDSRSALADLACAYHVWPTEELFTVGVTGTKGKTSVSHLSAAVLGELGKVELVSTIVNALERDWEQTTPEAPLIQGIARRAREKGKTELVLEVSAHGLALARARGVDFDVAVFTNLSHDHLDYFGEMERYFRAKLLLFRSLKPNAAAVVNGDERVAEQVIRSTKASVLTYGLRAGADIRAERIEQGRDGINAVIRTPSGKKRLSLRLPGLISLQNALAAMGVGLVRGVALPGMISRLEEITGIEGRLEALPLRGGATAVIDFAHSPASLEAALQALAPFYDRVITVFGCGGDADRAKRPMMGEISARYSDYTIITSDNPKGEDPGGIVRQVEAGMPNGAPYETLLERHLAIERALELIRRGDCLLIAGKGHERTQIFKGRAVSFNDKACLQGLGALEIDAEEGRGGERGTDEA